MKMLETDSVRYFLVDRVNCHSFHCTKHPSNYLAIGHSVYIGRNRDRLDI